MLFVLTIITLIYCAAVLVILVTLMKNEAHTKFNKTPFLSVIISARNEEERIKPTLNSLAQLTYPKEKYEIIFVDDASRDNTAGIIEEYIRKYDNWNIIKISEKSDKLKGKKAALKRAIEQAHGEIILTTDADCIVQPDWLYSVASVFDNNTVMVLGHSIPLKRDGTFNGFLMFDNLFTVILMAATTKLGFPITSMGSNLAYKKEAYIKSGGYDELSSHKSGDDVHLTELFRRKIKGKIVFNFRRDSFTRTQPPDTIKEIFFQQIRKNSKILRKSFPSVLFSFLLFFYHISLIAFPFLFPSLINLWLFLVLFKFICEFTALTFAAKKFSHVSIILLIPLMQIIYPVYVSVLALLGIFQKYEWKK